MKIKQTIILIVIVVALAGAGVFAYMTFGSPVAEVPATQETKAIILPHGNNLDFDDVNKFNETGRQFQYPVTLQSDIGLQLNEIISQ